MRCKKETRCNWRLQRHLSYFRRQTGTNTHATLILLGMVGPLCIGERWGRRDGLDNTASYPTRPPADHHEASPLFLPPNFSSLFWLQVFPNSLTKQQMLSIFNSTPNWSTS